MFFLQIKLINHHSVTIILLYTQKGYKSGLPTHELSNSRNGQSSALHDQEVVVVQRGDCGIVFAGTLHQP